MVILYLLLEDNATTEREHDAASRSIRAAEAILELKDLEELPTKPVDGARIGVARLLPPPF
jgi:hypothetical protein